jgi:hypothetical protein
MSSVIRPDFIKHRDDEELLTDLQAGAKVVAQASAAPRKEPPKSQRKRVEGRFVIAPLPDLIVAATALDSRPMLLWLFLVYEMRLRSTDHVKVTNGAVAPLRIDRSAKHHALKRLEAAGLITVERKGKQSPIVRLRACP